MYRYNIIPVTTNADFYTNKGTFFVNGNKAIAILEPNMIHGLKQMNRSILRLQIDNK